MHGRVAALARADGPWAARVVLPCGGGVVLALAVGVADRMDRRQVQDVEPELRHVRKAGGLHVLERAVLTRPPRGASREQFVPAAEPGSLRIHQDLELTVERNGLGAVRNAGHGYRQLVVESRGRVSPAEALCGLPEDPAISSLRPLR